ncbi:MAG: heme lyase CcmF/NrfE family subunit [Acidobacteriota bacterium]
MTPLLGRVLVLLALFCAAAGSVIAFSAGARRSLTGYQWARKFAYSFCGFMVAANVLMTYALVTHDFSVSYVAQVGSRSVPLWVSFVSLWSSLEGSILFWGLILSLYIAAATFANRDQHLEYMPYATGVWLACATFFSFLISGPAQPFLTMTPVPADGPGPNPLLQNHILMAIHPPFLYLGYVGMTIPFGLASAALLTGKLGHSFLRPLRTWLLVPWIFQTCAIVLGGWWAYEVLGWGGYWAWDPVENASLLPWLTATAAVHSLVVLERKGFLKGWTVTLIMSTFLLTILGTFMTRSGVFNSVHSFTQSSIGPTILVFLALALIWTVVLLASRVDTLIAEGTLDDPLSRESAFLVNNLLFVLLTFTILIGTVFPLVVEAMKGVQMSVGRPYFDRMSVPIGVALLFLMGVGPALPWGRSSGRQMLRSLLPPLIGGVALASIGAAMGVRNPWTLLTLFFGGYTAQVTMREMWRPMVQRMRKHGDKPLEAFVEGQLRRGRRRFGAYIVHSGAVVVFISIAVSSTMQTSRQVHLRSGESTTLGPYTLKFLGVEERPEPNRQSTIARVAVSRNGKQLAVMTPRMNQYLTQREPVGTPDVRTSLSSDLYLSILNVDPATQTVGFLALINPMVGWIWIATAVMAFGGVIALVSPRKAAERSALAPSTNFGAPVHGPGSEPVVEGSS